MGNNDISQMGLSSFQQIKQKEKVSTDPRLNQYVQCVAQAVTRVIPAQYAANNPGQWEVVVFDSDDVNAFALPGGRIGVYTGLLKVAKIRISWPRLSAMKYHMCWRSTPTNDCHKVRSLISGWLPPIRFCKTRRPERRRWRH